MIKGDAYRNCIVTTRSDSDSEDDSIELGDEEGDEDFINEFNYNKICNYSTRTYRRLHIEECFTTGDLEGYEDVYKCLQSVSNKLHQPIEIKWNSEPNSKITTKNPMGLSVSNKENVISKKLFSTADENDTIFENYIDVTNIKNGENINNNMVESEKENNYCNEKDGGLNIEASETTRLEDIKSNYNLKHRSRNKIQTKHASTTKDNKTPERNTQSRKAKTSLIKEANISAKKQLSVKIRRSTRLNVKKLSNDKSVENCNIDDVSPIKTQTNIINNPQRKTKNKPSKETVKDVSAEPTALQTKMLENLDLTPIKKPTEGKSDAKENSSLTGRKQNAIYKDTSPNHKKNKVKDKGKSKRRGLNRTLSDISDDDYTEGKKKKPPKSSEKGKVKRKTGDFNQTLSNTSDNNSEPNKKMNEEANKNTNKGRRKKRDLNQTYSDESEDEYIEPAKMINKKGRLNTSEKGLVKGKTQRRRYLKPENEFSAPNKDINEEEALNKSGEDKGRKTRQNFKRISSDISETKNKINKKTSISEKRQVNRKRADFKPTLLHIFIKAKDKINEEPHKLEKKQNKGKRKRRDLNCTLSDLSDDDYIIPKKKINNKAARNKSEKEEIIGETQKRKNFTEKNSDISKDGYIEKKTSDDTQSTSSQDVTHNKPKGRKLFSIADYLVSPEFDRACRTRINDDATLF